MKILLASIGMILINGDRSTLGFYLTYNFNDRRFSIDCQSIDI